MNAKHTPGPWITESCDTGMEILDMRGESVAVACHFGDPYSSIREEANAILIAAAPELLEIARAVAVSSAKFTPEFREQIRAAIAKATGETI